VAKKEFYMSRGVIEKDLVLLFSSNAEVTKAVIVDSAEFGFNLKFTIAGEDKLLMNARRRREARTFKTIDAAVRVCRAVGLVGAVEVWA
jgi:hypothetical protein